MRVLVALVVVFSCSGSGEERTDPPRTTGRERQTDRRPDPLPEETPPASLPASIPTDPLEPRPVRIAIADLPAPFHTESASQRPEVVPMPEEARLRVPRGFAVQVFADGLDQPRWLALTPDGRVLLAETRINRLRLLTDADHDGVAESIETFATEEDNELDIPFGMAFAGGHFYLGNQDEVRRYPYREGQTRLEGRGERIAALPGGGYNQHWTRNVMLAPDGSRLFVSIGSESNVDADRLPRASVQVMGLDGSGMRTFASGLRNPVGLDFHPRTGDLYATVNERDGLGDDLVPDYFTRVEEGAFYGWPYAYLTPSLLDPRRMRRGRSERPDLAARTRSPDVLFQAHSAALGVRFYRGDAFPERYRDGAFVAFRGSWNRGTGTGYKIVFVPFERGRPVGHYEDFLTGFLLDPSVPTTWGRPVGVLVLPDGSLIFTEEMNGRIFRVSFRGDRATPRPGP